MEKQILHLLEEKGPLTGGEIWQGVGGEALALWRICRISKNLRARTVGTRYLRLDRRVEGFARMSPSILREFLTYSVVGPAGKEDLLSQKAEAVILHIEQISKSKLELAYRVVSGLTDKLDGQFSLSQGVCFIIAGDIVYNMAHDVPRPERSTGRLVMGSDVDLVVIVGDDCPEGWIRKLDEAIYKEKYSLLMAPHLKEEIDYIVKRLGRVREQVCFDSFRHMVACKILDEGALLYGSEDLFGQVKAMLRESGATDRLRDLENRASAFRRDAEAYLLRENPEDLKAEDLNLFYPSEESEEFE
jgi:hypothetical protein